MPIDYNFELRLSYLRAAQAAQEEIESDIQTYRDYFDGEQGVELTDRQGEYLTEEVESFGNICKRVVNIPKDRMELTHAGIGPADEESADYADSVSDWWNANRLQSRQKEIYQSSLRDSGVAIIVGYDTVNNRPTFTPNLLYDGETGLVRFHYDSDDNLMFASKRWTTWNPLRTAESVSRRLTVYRPDMIDRYEASAGGNWQALTPEQLGGIPNPQPWVMPDGEPIGIPVIPFENPGGSELADVINIQQLLNHNLGTFDISVDFHAFPLLWIVNAELPLNSEGNRAIPDYGPGKAILMGEGGQAGRIEPADLKAMFEAGIMSWVQLLSIVKGWPLFALSRSAEVPSGIALQIAEGGLVKQIKDKQAVFSDSWRNCFDIGRKLHRLAGGEDLPGELNIEWTDPATVDELAHYEALVKKYEALQIPVISRWREAGYTQDQIDEMIADAAANDGFGFAGANDEVEQ